MWSLQVLGASNWNASESAVRLRICCRNSAVEHDTWTWSDESIRTSASVPSMCKNSGKIHLRFSVLLADPVNRDRKQRPSVAGNSAMLKFTSFRARSVPQVQAVILTPDSSTYGSLELARLEQFGVDLADFAVDCTARSVIVDLSGVALHGSGFLRELHAFAVRLRPLEARLIVCGDHAGLVHLVGGEAWCQVTADLVDALNACCREPVAV